MTSASNHNHVALRRFRVLVAAICAMAAQVCTAQMQSSVSHVEQSAAKDSNYLLLTTTLPEAIEYWRSRGMNTVQWGHLALGSGHVPADKIVLVDVVGADFEGMSYARFYFYDNKLYRIQAPFRSGPPFSVNPESYSGDEIIKLEAMLIRKHGNPLLYRSYFSSKDQKKDVMVWNIDRNKLTLLTNPEAGGLIFANEKAEADVKSYIKSYCRQFNTHGAICW